MALVFTPLSWWLSRGKQKETRICDVADIRNVASSSSRNIKRKWGSREERKIDTEYDIVLVPPDGGCISGSESDDSDWSVGWLELHGPGFQSSDDSFAVLVPCYGRGGGRDVSVEEDSKNKIPDGNKYMEQWLSSL